METGKRMESNVHTPWFQGSKITNKTLFLCLSISDLLDLAA